MLAVPFSLISYMVKSLISIEQLRAYTGNYEEDTLGLYDVVVQSATEIVVDYLGYNPWYESYDEWISGAGGRKLYLNARDIENVNFLEINGQEADICDIGYKDDYIYSLSGKAIFKEGVDNIHVMYTAGLRQLPKLLTLSTLRIASLMLQEFNSNIGISSKSFADQSRTFINYSNYDKYLQPLKALRIFKI